MYIASKTVFGLNAALDQTRQSGALIIGYDRDFAIIVPRSVDELEDDGAPNGDKEVMSTFGCTGMATNGTVIRSYSDLIVSGDAAVMAASDPEVTKLVQQCGPDKLVEKEAVQGDSTTPDSNP